MRRPGQGGPEHEWVKTDGPPDTAFKVTFPNTWTCSRCGARSGPLHFKPSPRSRVSPDGYVRSGSPMTCGSYAAHSVISS